MKLVFRGLQFCLVMQKNANTVIVYNAFLEILSKKYGNLFRQKEELISLEQINDQTWLFVSLIISFYKSWFSIKKDNN